jgi:hypothetical protein
LGQTLFCGSANEAGAGEMGKIVWRLGILEGNRVDGNEAAAFCLLDWPIGDGESRNSSVDRCAGRRISNFPSIDPSLKTGALVRVALFFFMCVGKGKGARHAM